MSEAIEAYYHITAESEFRERERLYEKARHIEASALYYAECNAKRKNSLEIARNLLSLDVQVDKIVKSTGLTHKEVEALLNDSQDGGTGNE